MFEEALVAQLKTIAALSNRIYPVTGVQSAAAPYIVYLQSDSAEFEILKGYTGRKKSSYELNILDKTYSGMKSVAASVVTLLKTFQGATIGGILVQGLSFDENSPELWENEPQLFRKIINFEVIY
jgi:hypothetical protein